ncbi:DUF4954 family protein [Candidatus Sumerlaeota bacterium]|nr:DUF4954 family protein [Candidatus Sumerlaeota bacterium]
MSTSLSALVGDALESSELLATTARINSPGGKSILFGDSVRALEPQEQERLRAHSCSAESWDRILVTDDFNPAHFWGTHFMGDVILGATGTPVDLGHGITMPAGVYKAVVANCEIGDGALVHSVGLLSNVVLDSGAAVANTQTVAADAGTAFGNGREIGIAIETGGREVKLYAEITVDVAAKIASSRGDSALLEEYGEFVDGYTAKAKAAKGYIGVGARILNTGKVINTFVGEGAVIDNATKVENATVLSSADERTEILDGSFVVNSLIQWGCEVTSMAIVDKSALCEHSHVERHGKVTESVVGPNTGIAEGEVTACLVGPFVGFHHQALLIAAFWPEGKGNIGYGANVGSNHTGKAPDQEIWCGEGTFFGLGVNIKMPSDFTRAPYSIIATAVNALPQRLEMPFSLVNTPAALHEGISPAYNEIMPGWVLSDNIFSVKRNEGKYAKRNRARRAEIVTEVFRPDIVDLMIEARSRLQAASGKEIYTDRDVKGLGKNYMSERSRVAGIEAYTFYLRWYALNGLRARLAAEGKVDLEAKSGDARWEHERQVLLAEFSERDPKALLRELIAMQEKIAQDVETSKAKDDKRGPRVIDDYAEAHAPASKDGFVKETHAATEALRAEVEKIIAGL